jgi:hypothetical protein
VIYFTRPVGRDHFDWLAVDVNEYPQEISLEHCMDNDATVPDGPNFVGRRQGRPQVGFCKLALGHLLQGVLGEEQLPGSQRMFNIGEFHVELSQARLRWTGIAPLVR